MHSPDMQSLSKVREDLAESPRTVLFEHHGDGSVLQWKTLGLESFGNIITAWNVTKSSCIRRMHSKNILSISPKQSWMTFCNLKAWSWRFGFPRVEAR
jgi:hypothetical protein